MTSGQNGQAQRYIRTIQRTLARLEDLVRETASHVPEPRIHDPRSELLEQVHLSGAMEQRDLFRLLDGRLLLGASHTKLARHRRARWRHALSVCSL